MRFNSHVRQALAAMLAGATVLLGACAGMPAEKPVALSGEPGAKFNSGSVTLYVTDYGGQPLRQAWVDIESNSEGQDYFRNAGMTDYNGRVTFRGVPEQVRISVNHNETRGYYSRAFAIPPSGTTELRMMLETMPVEPRPAPEPPPEPMRQPVPARR